MLNKKKLCATAVAGLACIAPATARSQVSASAALTGLSFTLTDLAPDDGIAPSMTLNLVDAHANVAAFDTAPPLGPPASEASLQHFGSISATGTYGFAQAALDQDSLSVASAGAYGAYRANVHKSFIFSVQPHTLVTFTILTTPLIAVDGPPPSEATAYFDMSGMFVNEAPGGERTGFTRFETSRVAISGGDAAPLTASLYAEGPPLFGELDLDLRLEARGLQPIPEPAGWAMLLAGLALAGARRAAAWRPFKASA